MVCCIQLPIWTHEKYHILISAIASAGNVSTNAQRSSAGAHLAEHVRMADGEEVDINLRLETVPAINGMDIVMRLFNMRQDYASRARQVGLVAKANALSS